MNRQRIGAPTKTDLTTARQNLAVATQRKIDEGTGLLCVGDDKLDYRSAWETDAPDEAAESQGTIT